MKADTRFNYPSTHVLNFAHFLGLLTYSRECEWNDGVEAEKKKTGLITCEALQDQTGRHGQRSYSGYLGGCDHCLTSWPQIVSVATRKQGGTQCGGRRWNHLPTSEEWGVNSILTSTPQWRKSFADRGNMLAGLFKVSCFVFCLERALLWFSSNFCPHASS